MLGVIVRFVSAGRCHCSNRSEVPKLELAWAAAHPLPLQLCLKHLPGTETVGTPWRQQQFHHCRRVLVPLVRVVKDALHCIMLQSSSIILH